MIPYPRLVDLEVRLAREQDADGRAPARVADRDRAVGTRLLADLGVSPPEARRRIVGDRAFRQRLVRAWLDAVRRPDERSPGEALRTALGAAGWILIVLGLLLGAAAASALLAYDGSRPVNVLAFLAVLIGLQILILLALVLALCWSAIRRQAPGPGLAARLVLALSRARAIRALAGGKGGDAAFAAEAWARRREAYPGVERWLLFGLTQRFGVAFNAGALAACLWLVTFSDLVFGWSTTLQVTAADVHSLTAALATPWSMFPDAVPSADVVAASQWVRMPGQFVGNRPLATAVPLAAQWWRFLVAGLLVYGLLPRLLAAALAHQALRAALRRVPLDHADCQRLYERLLPPDLAWLGPEPGTVRGPRPAEPAATSEHWQPARDGIALWAVTWGSVGADPAQLAPALERRFGARAAGTLAAGGADLRADADSLAKLAAARAEMVVLLLAAGQQPTKDVLRYLRELRRAVGARAQIAALVLDPEDGALHDVDAQQRRIWHRALASLGDARLRLCTLETVQ